MRTFYIGRPISLRLSFSCLTYAQRFLITVSLTLCLTNAAASTSPGELRPGSSAYTLSYLLKAATEHHPSIKSSLRSAEAAVNDIDVAKRQRWPQISVVAETNNNQSDVMASALRVARLQQTLWDFGRIGSLVNEAEKRAHLASIEAELQEQDLHIQVISAWQQLIASHQRMLVAQTHLQTLYAYRSQMQRRVEAQASPSIDLELVESRVLQGQVELTSAQTQYEHSLFVLEQLTATKGLSSHISSLVPTFDTRHLTTEMRRLQQTNWSDVAQQHIVVQAAQLQHLIASNLVKTISAEQYPQIYFRLNQPLSKTQPFNNTKPSWFVGLSYTPGAGFSGSAQVESQVIRAEAARENIGKAKLDIEQALLSDYRDFSSSLARLSSIEQSVNGAEKVMESYQRQFQAGRKSWLDLLNAARELSQSQYMLAETVSTIAAAYERLQIRTKASKQPIRH